MGQVEEGMIMTDTIEHNKEFHEELAATAARIKETVQRIRRNGRTDGKPLSSDFLKQLDELEHGAVQIERTAKGAWQ